MKLYGKLTLRYFFLIGCILSSNLLKFNVPYVNLEKLRFFYYNRCFNDTIFNHDFRIQEFARIYLYCQLYIRVTVIQFFEKFYLVDSLSVY